MMVPVLVHLVGTVFREMLSDESRPLPTPAFRPESDASITTFIFK